MAHKTKLEVGVLVVMLCAFLAFVVTATVVFLPFEPLSYNSVSAPEEACAQDGVEINLDYNLDEDSFDSIRAIETQSSWIAEDVPGVPDGAERIIAETTLLQDQIEPGRTIRPGLAQRIAPEDLGVWRLKLRSVVRGTPTIQEVAVTAENNTTVLGRDNPECDVR